MCKIGDDLLLRVIKEAPDGITLRQLHGRFEALAGIPLNPAAQLVEIATRLEELGVIRITYRTTVEHVAGGSHSVSTEPVFHPK